MVLKSGRIRCANRILTPYRTPSIENCIEQRDALSVRLATMTENTTSSDKLGTHGTKKYSSPKERVFRYDDCKYRLRSAVGAPDKSDDPNAGSQGTELRKGQPPVCFLKHMIDTAIDSGYGTPRTVYLQGKPPPKMARRGKNNDIGRIIEIGLYARNNWETELH